MSPHDTSKTATYHDFGGKSRRFLLRIGEMEELEQRCNAAIGLIMFRVASGQFSVKDVWCTIELALIGGGENRKVAEQICARYQGDPLYEWVHIPAAVLTAALMGVKTEVPQDQSGNVDAADQE